MKISCGKWYSGKMKITLTYGSKCSENKYVYKHLNTITDALNKKCLIFYLFYNEQSTKKMLVDDRHNQMMVEFSITR